MSVHRYFFFSFSSSSLAVFCNYYLFFFIQILRRIIIFFFFFSNTYKTSIIIIYLFYKLIYRQLVVHSDIFFCLCIIQFFYIIRICIYYFSRRYCKISEYLLPLLVVRYSTDKIFLKEKKEEERQRKIVPITLTKFDYYEIT